MNLGLLYQEKLGKLLSANDMPGARDAAAKIVKYSPANMQGHMTLGLLDYASGDKAGAVAELNQVKASDAANFRKRFDQAVQRNPAFKAIANDQEILKQLFPN
jgi:hypothetical protein